MQRLPVAKAGQNGPQPSQKMVLRILLPLTVLLFMAQPMLAQRPTAERAAPAGNSFWPVDRPTGTVVFVGPTARPQASNRWQAEHLRTWLTQTCARWGEVQTQRDSTQLYQGELAGVHAGVALRFILQLRRLPLVGWQYQLLAFQVRSPTRTDVVHWLPLHRLLDDADFRPDVRHFQQLLQQALPTL